MAQAKSSFVARDGVANGVATLDAQGQVVQSISPSSSKSIGDGQTWQVMTASRAANVTYTNTTGRPILVSILYGNNGGAYAYGSLTVSGQTISRCNITTPNPADFNSQTVQAVVPSGGTYAFTLAYGAMASWMELR